MLEKIKHIIKQGFTQDNHDDLRSKALALRAETKEDQEEFIIKFDNIRNQMILADYQATYLEKTAIEIIIRSLAERCNSRQIARLLRIAKPRNVYDSVREIRQQYKLLDDEPTSMPRIYPGTLSVSRSNDSSRQQSAENS